MGITDETQFKSWYESYYGENSLSGDEFKKHLAEAFMAGYAMGYAEAEFFNKEIKDEL